MSTDRRAVNRRSQRARHLRAMHDPAYRARRALVASKYDAVNTEKARARSKIYDARKRGAIVRPDVCEACGKKCAPDAHHDDYSKVLEVRWLCRRCHMALHRRMADGE